MSVVNRAEMLQHAEQALMHQRLIEDIDRMIAGLREERRVNVDRMVMHRREAMTAAGVTYWEDIPEAAS